MTINRITGAANPDYRCASFIALALSPISNRGGPHCALCLLSLSCSVPTEDGSRTTIVEKYLIIWKKGEDGDWYLHRDIWNADA